jgi:uncharacterized protein (TIGR00369 family)
MDDQSKQLSLNDETDYGLCFACGPRNPWGLKLRFERDGDTVVSHFEATEEYQGFPGYLHGGVITALLDEVMSRVSLVLENRWTMTAGVDVRFRKPVFIGQEVTAVAEHVETNRRVVKSKAKVLLPDGTVAADATGKFVYVPETTLAQMTAGYPQLARDWMRADLSTGT